MMAGHILRLLIKRRIIKMRFFMDELFDFVPDIPESMNRCLYYLFLHPQALLLYKIIYKTELYRMTNQIALVSKNKTNPVFR